MVNALKSWFDSQAVEEQMQEDGTKKIKGTEAKDLLVKLRKGDRQSFERIKENKTVKEKFQLDNFDLVTWFLVTV